MKEEKFAMQPERQKQNLISEKNSKSWQLTYENLPDKSEYLLVENLVRTPTARIPAISHQDHRQTPVWDRWGRESVECQTREGPKETK